MTSYNKELSDLRTIGDRMGYQSRIKEIETRSRTETACVWGDEYVFRPGGGIFNPMTNVEQESVEDGSGFTEYVIGEDDLARHDDVISSTDIESLKALCDVVHPSVGVVESVLRGERPSVVEDLGATTDTKESENEENPIDNDWVESNLTGEAWKQICETVGAAEYVNNRVYYTGKPIHVANQVTNAMVEQKGSQVGVINDKERDICYTREGGRYIFVGELGYEVLDEHLRFVKNYCQDYTKASSTDEDNSADENGQTKRYWGIEEILEEIESANYVDGELQYEETARETAEEIMDHLDGIVVHDDDFPIEGEDGEKVYHKIAGDHFYNNTLDDEDFFSHLQYIFENTISGRVPEKLKTSLSDEPVQHTQDKDLGDESSADENPTNESSTDESHSDESHGDESPVDQDPVEADPVEEAAPVDQDPIKENPIKNHPTSELTSEIQELEEMIGEPPSADVVRNYAAVDDRHVEPVEDLQHVIESVCDDGVYDEDDREYTRLDILTEIEHLMNQTQGKLTITKFGQKSDMSVSLPSSRFGSWGDATQIVRRANANSSRASSDQDGDTILVDDKRDREDKRRHYVECLNSVSNEVAGSLSEYQYERLRGEGMPPADELVSRFGSWNAAKRDADIS